MAAVGAVGFSLCPWACMAEVAHHSEAALIPDMTVAADVVFGASGETNASFPQIFATLDAAAVDVRLHGFQRVRHGKDRVPETVHRDNEHSFVEGNVPSRFVPKWRRKDTGVRLAVANAVAKSITLDVKIFSISKPLKAGGCLGVLLANRDGNTAGTPMGRSQDLKT